MSLKQFVQQNKMSIIYLTLMGIVALVVSSVLTFYAVRYERAIQEFDLFYWMIFYICTCFTMAFALTPTTFIALLSGYFLGWLSLPFICISYMIACWIGYRAAAFFDQGKFMEAIKARKGASQLIERLKTGQLEIIILCRLSPVLPFAIMNVVLSMIKVDIRKFVVGSFVGMLPRTIITIWAGTQAREIRVLLESGEENNTMQIGFILLFTASLIGLFYYFKKALQRV